MMHRCAAIGADKTACSKPKSNGYTSLFIEPDGKRYCAAHRPVASTLRMREACEHHAMDWQPRPHTCAWCGEVLV